MKIVITCSIWNNISKKKTNINKVQQHDNDPQADDAIIKAGEMTRTWATKTNVRADETGVFHGIKVGT